MPSIPYCDEYVPSNFEALLPVIQSNTTTHTKIIIQIKLDLPYKKLNIVPNPPLITEATLNWVVLITSSTFNVFTSS